ncbi:MAG TPA: hypothetical protein VKB49_18785 [Candidatus Sulfotelmatobacter sp.]|nr:hypothetical protein [Candidatus Sulfotelmatobacter sp.]
MPRLKWFTWLVVLAAGIGSWGLVWLAISPQLAKYGDHLEWLTSGLETSVPARIVGLLAVLVFAVATSEWLLRIMGRNP